MTQRKFLVVGGSGFVGRHLVAALAARGASVTVPTRRRERAKHLILLPTVDVVEADVRDSRALAELAAGCDVVVNLVGILHGPGFKPAHVELAQAVVNACRKAGVARLLHMSALGADPAAPSEYLRTKGIGEQAVLAAGARFQPVYVGDVVKAMLAALDSREAAGKRYDLCGPVQYSLRELIEFVCAATGRRRLVIGLPDALSYLQACAMEMLPGPLLTRDNYRSMQVPSVCDCEFPFGIQPVSLAAAAPAWLSRGPLEQTAGLRERFAQLRWRARR